MIEFQKYDIEGIRDDETLVCTNFAPCIICGTQKIYSVELERMWKYNGEVRLIKRTCRTTGLKDGLCRDCWIYRNDREE